MNERIYELTELTPPKYPKGEFRLAQDDDLELLKVWARQFAIDAKMPQHEIESISKRFSQKITSNSVGVWTENGTLKAMAAFDGKTPKGIRVGYVFTPKELRGQGYGSAVTASITEYLLNNGNEYCFLFTDLSNPTSNSIYKKIGYREVCDIKMIEFLHQDS